MNSMDRIRRFDIFAIFNMTSKENELGKKYAKGYGIWMARMVAGRKFGAVAAPGHQVGKGKDYSKTKVSGIQAWNMLSGKPQTDKEYEKELVKRFGEANLTKLENFVSKAYHKGMTYNAIRDCKHNLNSGNRFKTGWCAECSKDFDKVFSKMIK